MEPLCRCHLRATSYLLLDADVILLFVSAVFSELRMLHIYLVSYTLGRIER